MKAIQYERYGAPEVLHMTEVAAPAPKDNEVLIRNYATAITSGDVRLRKADPFMVRFMLGLFRPAKKIPGFVFAGIVEEAGKNVTRFKPGDKVYGTSFKNFATYAEFVCIPEDGIIAEKPATLSFEEVAAIPFGGSTALHFLKTAKIQKGQKILVHGASGAVGTSVIQIAKYFGAEVTAMCSPANFDLVKSLGADQAFDYATADFNTLANTYDIVFDAVGKSPFAASVKSLKPTGYYLRMVHMAPGPIFKGLWVSATSRKKVIGGVVKETVEGLELLNKMILEGQLKPVIDRIYAFDQVVAAHAYVEQGHKKGNVIMRIREDATAV